MLTWPITLRVKTIEAMLNCELADHPVYDGLELQWFDDERHGAGMLAFLSRRADRRVDYYVEPGLRLDSAEYRIGGGTGAWTQTTFEVARLRVADDGVDAEVRFTDVDGRPVELRIDDRDGRPRRRGALLAPVGAAIEDPGSLMLVWMPRFDLVRATRPAPVVRIDGVDAAIGRLPALRLHRHHLVKYAAGLVVVDVAPEHDGPLPDRPGRGDDADGDGVVGIVAGSDGHVASFEAAPPLPDLTTLPEGGWADGAWFVTVDQARVTGGRWSAQRTGDRIDLGLDVTQRWRPGRLPALMRVVTRLVPVFRRWPTSYRWRATAWLGEVPVATARWERTGSGGAEAYRRATSS